MALIGKIRQRSWVLLGFIGIALFVFLLEAALNQNSLFSRASGGTVGNIGGKKIAAEYFQQKEQGFEQAVKIFNPNLEMNEANRASIRSQVWDDITFESLLGKKLSKMGIGISNEEIAASIKGDIQHSLAKQFFASLNNGKPFEKAQLDQLFATLDKNDPDGKVREAILSLENIIKDEKIKSKYAALLTKSLYIPTFLAKDNYEGNKGAQVAFASIPYSTIKADQVKVTDEEIKKYIDEHKNSYNTQPTRNIDIVEFPIQPTPNDLLVINQKLTSIIDEFKSTTNDSLFIVRKSKQGASITYYTADDLKGRTNIDSLMSKPVGSFVGPYKESNYLMVTKIVDRKILADSARAAHILLTPKTPEEAESLNAMADTLIEQLRKNPNTFGQKASELSQDEGSKKQGGDLGVFPRGAMVKPFNDLVFIDMKPGEIKKVQSQFGIHIVFLLGLKGGQPATKIADFAVELAASDDTEKDIYNKANSFWQKNTDATAFDKAAKTQISNKDIQLAPDGFQLGSVGESREVVKWAFNEKKVGAINLFTLKDKYVIVKLSKIKPEGLPTVDDVRTSVTEILANKKRGELLVKKLEGAKTGATTLSDIAAKTGAIIKDTVSLQYNSDFVDGAGNEPALVGAAFGTPEGKISKAVAGNSAAFVVVPKSIVAPTSPPMIEMYKSQMASQLAQRIDFRQILESIKKNNKIEDKLFKVF
jgi:peptidyl-prolyl cis-trans isomerase D